MLWSMFKTAPMPKLPIKNFNKTSTKVLFTQGNLTVRNQTFPDVEDTVNTLMRSEGWPGMLHFWPIIFALDPDGYYMLEHNNKKIASISMVSYLKIKFAYVGMYVVEKELRSQGFGKILFEKILEHTTANRGISTIGLNCHEQMCSLYRQWGFETYTTDGIWKLSGYVAPENDTKQVYSLDTNTLTKLFEYDATIFGTNRNEFLNSMINKPNTATVFVEDEKQIKGFGIISQRDPAQPEANASYRIGPLYANNEKLAYELLKRLLAAVNLTSDQNVFLEAPDNNSHAAVILSQLGFKRLTSMNKMYLGPPPKFIESKIFGYTSLAFGG